MKHVVKLGREEDFDKFVLKTKITLVDFYAEWCGPCKMLAPVLEEIAEEVDDDVSVLSVDVDNAQNLSEKYSIRSIPTIIIFKDGKATQKSVGAQSKTAILEAIESIRER